MTNEEKQNPETIDMENTPPKKKELATFLDILESFVLSAVAVVLLFTLVFRITIVDGPSMQDTLLHGDALLVSNLFYTPECGDVVIVHQPTEFYPDPIVKRVIAVGGQTIDIDFNTWTVTVDGVVLEEDYIKLTNDQRITSDFTFPMEIPEGYVFVMGDNRNHSADSRSSKIGLIDERMIVGHVLLRFMPFSTFGAVD